MFVPFSSNFNYFGQKYELTKIEAYTAIVQYLLVHPSLWAKIYCAHKPGWNPQKESGKRHHTHRSLISTISTAHT